MSTYSHSGDTTTNDQDSLLALLHATRVGPLVKDELGADLGQVDIGSGECDTRHV